MLGQPMQAGAPRGGAAVVVARRRIPHRCQHASPERLPDVLVGRARLQDDPRWRESGAREVPEYVRWARSGCGMACLQMILAARGQDPPPLAELGRRAIPYGAYEAEPARGFGPLIYRGFVDFVGAEFDLRAEVAAPLPITELVERVAAEEVVLASVSSEIRTPAARPARRGGHLVLVFECSPERSSVCFHDPAGGPESSRAVWLELDAFARFYAERGIAVTLPRGGRA